MCAAMRTATWSLSSLVILVVAGCGDDLKTPITIVPPSDQVVDSALRELVAMTPYDGLRIAATAPAGDGFTIDVALGDACAQCYTLEATSATSWTVHAGGLLGAQYGVTHALENLGFRFRTPTQTYVPASPAFDPEASASLGVLYEPHVPGDRGLQLHTLHPIEAYFAVWEPTSDVPARQIFDWIVKNRGNHVQWPALDDIMDAERQAAWLESTRRLLDLAHGRGLTVGLGTQIFGKSNMQAAFDLSDSDGSVPIDREIAARLPRITRDLPFDEYILSFGEFVGVDPERFLSAVDQVVAALDDARPGVAIHAAIHVGGDQVVSYQGEDLPYYFLVKHADPSIVSNVHTVMYYTLYEPTGGAYEHQDFSAHREYLFDQMRSGRRASYYPETAYWIAFDNSVPLFLPVYVRSRWLDLFRIDADARAEGLRGLDDHPVFSSGWEWGYWLNDYATLRASYTLPPNFRDLIAHAYGSDLAPAVDLVSEMADVQAQALIHGKLAAYVSGRDILIDTGDRLGIYSQPDRWTFDELARADAAQRARFVTDVLEPLGAHAAELESILRRLRGLGLPDQRWARELIDGATVTAARARFAHTAYAAVIAHADGDAGAVATLRSELASTHAIAAQAVARRHAQPHYTGPRDHLFGRPLNATVYAYGYLHHADTLCYWARELAQLEAVVDGTDPDIPGCYL